VNKFDRNDAFNSEGIRKAMADIKVKPSLEGADGKPVVEMSRLARQTANRLSQENYSPTMIIGSLRLAEFALLALTGFVVHALYVGLSSDSTVYLYLPAILIGSTLAVLLIQIADGYQVPALRSALRTLAQGAECLDDCLRHDLRAGILHAVPAWLSPDSGLRPGMFPARSDWSSCAISSPIGIRRWARNGIMERRAVIVGGGEIAKGLIRSIEMDAENDIRICGIFDDRSERRSPAIVAGYPKLGNVERPGRVRADCADRHADRLHSAERGVPGTGTAEETLGPASGHSTCPPIPTSSAFEPRS
jgi:hypothetical protein